MKNTELTKIREDKKLSKSEFAKILGVTAMLLGKYEKGSCKIPENVAEKALAFGAGKAVKDAVGDKVKKDAKAAAGKTVKKAAKKAAKVAVEKKVAKEAVEVAAGVAVAKEVKKAATKKAAAKKAKKPTLYIESLLGGSVTPEEIIKRLPDDVETVYVKPEENKAYYTAKSGDGFIIIWE